MEMNLSEHFKTRVTCQISIRQTISDTPFSSLIMKVHELINCFRKSFFHAALDKEFPLWL